MPKFIPEPKHRVFIGTVDPKGISSTIFSLVKDGLTRRQANEHAARLRTELKAAGDGNKKVAVYAGERFRSFF